MVNKISESPKTRSLCMEERSMMPIVWMITKSVAADLKAMKRTESKQRQEEENQVEKREQELDGSKARLRMLTKKRFAECGKIQLPDVALLQAAGRRLNSWEGQGVERKETEELSGGYNRGVVER